MPPRNEPMARIKKSSAERHGTTPATEISGSAKAIEPPPERPWPEPMADEAFIGPLGEYARAVLPHTEADPAAILAQSLVMFGNAIGRNAYFEVGNGRHHTNLFVVIVGATSGGKKGTSWNDARAAFHLAEPDWESRIVGGLSSGEGMMYAVRDADPAKEDPGEPDKRLLAHEPEFSRVLAQSARQGNILSQVIRQAWDNGNLRNMVRNNPIKATDAHISIIGHITPEELVSQMTANDMVNGLGNRFLWLMARRSKSLPVPTPPPAALLNRTRAALAKAIEYGRTAGEMVRTPEATDLWKSLYDELDADRPGMVGKLTARATPQVIRLAMVYALSMNARQVDYQHIEAAVAVWDYCLRSVEYLFGERDADRDRDEIHRLIAESPQGISREDISNYFHRHIRSAALTDKLHDLVRQGHIHGNRDSTTGGRPREMWFPIIKPPRGQTV